MSVFVFYCVRFYVFACFFSLLPCLCDWASVCLSQGPSACLCLWFFGFICVFSLSLSVLVYLSVCLYFSVQFFLLMSKNMCWCVCSLFSLHHVCVTERLFEYIPVLVFLRLFIWLGVFFIFLFLFHGLRVTELLLA